MTSAITDFTQYTSLRKAAGENDPAALREVANQFEALFLQTMLKSMREASMGDPLFGDSEQQEMYQGMMDQQLAVELASGKGVGLADMLVRQLGGTEAARLSRPDGAYPIERSSPVSSRLEKPAWADPDAFARDIWPHAERTAKELNVAPEAILAQAALETGWGKHVMPGSNGEASFNLFGIKSGSGWSGDQVVRNTLEFKDGVPRQEQAKFRSYPNVSSAFADYTDFIGENPRYENVRGSGDDSSGFARALQESGYATDPEYAQKIQNILDGPTMRRVISDLRTGS
jgi:flagellar protein FlgJ